MNSNILYTDALRMEIAILQEDVSSINPGKAKFKIPTLITENNVGYIQTTSNNIYNKRNGNLSNSYVNMEDTITLNIPLEYTYLYGGNTDECIIPKGTRFIVAFIGANLNDIKIIGRYDNGEDDI